MTALLRGPRRQFSVKNSVTVSMYECVVYLDTQQGNDVCVYIGIQNSLSFAD